MRLTKNKHQYLKRNNDFLMKKKNTFTKLDKKYNLNNDQHQYQTHNKKTQGGIYLQKILKTNEGYKSLNKVIKIDSHNLMQCNKNIQNIFSSDEKSKKAISYILNTLNEKNKDKYRPLKLERNFNNSINYKNYKTEQNDIGNFKYNINDMNKFGKNQTPKKYEYDKYKDNKNENNSDSRTNIFNNNLEKINLNYSINNVNNMNIIEEPITNREYFNQTERSNYYYSNSLIDFNKENSFNSKQEFFKKININNNLKNYKKEKTIKDDKKLVHIQKIPSPKSSATKRQYSPFNDILSKSSNNFFINKIPIDNNENDYFNNLSLRHFENKNSLTKRTMEKEESCPKENNYETENPININSNNFLVKVNNNYLKNNNVVYRNKKAINQKVFQSNSLNNGTTRNKYNKRNYRCINSVRTNLNLKENEEKIPDIIYNNMNEEEEENKKNININKEELKKYLEHFIKDITPININQFVIYSHSNNNYKNEEIQRPNDNNENFSMNKSYTSFNKLHNFKNYNINNINSKKENILNNSTYMQEFEHLKLKKKIFDLNNNKETNSNPNKINKILVKKRPINDNIIPHTINTGSNNLTNDNSTGLYLCKQNKGENVLNISINIDNILMINNILKEAGFEIKQIKNNKTSYKSESKINLKKYNAYNMNSKDDSYKKKKYNSNVEIKKYCNKKEKVKEVIYGSNNKKSKRSPIKLEKNDISVKKKNLNNIKNDKKEEMKKKIFVKLNENFEEFENNYLKKTKEKFNDANNNINNIENENNSKIVISTPNFKIN